MTRQNTCCKILVNGSYIDRPFGRLQRYGSEKDLGGDKRANMENVLRRISRSYVFMQCSWLGFGDVDTGYV